MWNLKRKLVAAAMMVCIASAGAFAQKERDKRPPKNPDKVVVQPKKGEKPPPNTNQGDKKKGDKKGKP